MLSSCDVNEFLEYTVELQNIKVIIDNSIFYYSLKRYLIVKKEHDKGKTYNNIS